MPGRAKKRHRDGRRSSLFYDLQTIAKTLASFWSGARPIKYPSGCMAAKPVLGMTHVRYRQVEKEAILRCKSTLAFRLTPCWLKFQVYRVERAQSLIGSIVESIGVLFLCFYHGRISFSSQLVNRGITK